jgi:hypothetical protein
LRHDCMLDNGVVALILGTALWSTGREFTCSGWKMFRV